jgi:hypothetical protein
MNGNTAFLIACRACKVECMRLLAEAGCNTAAVNNNRETSTDLGSGEALQWLRELDTESKAAALQHRAQELLASGSLSEALTSTEKAVRLRPESTELARLLLEVQSAVMHELQERERQARIAEIELMAMLDGEPASINHSVEQSEKAQRKREKRRRQQQAKREASARRAQAMTEFELEQALEQLPQPELDRKALSPAVQKPTSLVIGAEIHEALPVRTAPDEFCCPITTECMQDPVIVAATGMTYEREAIVEWLSKHDTDPSTGVKLGENKQLVPNVIARKMIDSWSCGCLRI